MPSGSPPAGRVLNVNDLSYARAHKTAALRSAGFDVIEAATGSEALERAGADAPELVLLDVKLPDHDGVEVCRQLRQSAPGHNGSGEPAAAVILITAKAATPEDIARGAEAGADAYLVEPI